MSSKEQWPQRWTYESPLSYLRFSVQEGKQRYRWAAETIRQTQGEVIVLDAASGSGWGTKLLGENISQGYVLGIDIDNDTVRLAQQKY